MHIPYILLGLGAAGAGAGYLYYRHMHPQVQANVPLGASTTPLGQTAQMAAMTGHPAATLPMSVMEVQQALNQLGAVPALTADGQPGSRTTEAIKKFQSKANLTVDGNVGAQTAAALRTALAATGSLMTAGGFYVGGLVTPQNLATLVNYMNQIKVRQAGQRQPQRVGIAIPSYRPSMSRGWRDPGPSQHGYHTGQYGDISATCGPGYWWDPSSLACMPNIPAPPPWQLPLPSWR